MGIFALRNLKLNLASGNSFKTCLLQRNSEFESRNSFERGISDAARRLEVIFSELRSCSQEAFTFLHNRRHFYLLPFHAMEQKQQSKGNGGLILVENMKQMLKLVELLHKPTSIQESKQNIYLRANLGTHRRWFLVDFFHF